MQRFNPPPAPRKARLRTNVIGYMDSVQRRLFLAEPVVPQTPPKSVRPSQEPVAVARRRNKVRRVVPAGASLKARWATIRKFYFHFYLIVFPVLSGF
jgi:hypothetical protein